MYTDKKIWESINSGISVIIARFLLAVFAAIFVVVVLSFTGVFLTTMTQTLILLFVAMPSAVFGLLVLALKGVRESSRTKYILCALMCLQAFGVAMAGYSYVGTVILLLPILLSALYPRSKIYGTVSAAMILCGIIVPPLALVSGFWDGGYFEFLYDLTNGRHMDTATLSNVMLTQKEQIMSALRFCSSQNVLITGGFTIIGWLIYRQTNKSFESQKEVIRLSETDELTGLYNRNSFERRLSETEAFRTRSLTCFYFDVNGLHEMNNTKGHKAGDIMLQFVGKSIQDVFGEENTFRIGGDEYVAFSGDFEEETLSSVKQNLEEVFATQNYHVAIGYAQSTATTDVDGLVQQAETEMYQAKNNYYAEHGRR